MLFWGTGLIGKVWRPRMPPECLITKSQCLIHGTKTVPSVYESILYTRERIWTLSLVECAQREGPLSQTQRVLTNLCQQSSSPSAPGPMKTGPSDMRFDTSRNHSWWGAIPWTLGGPFRQETAGAHVPLRCLEAEILDQGLGGWRSAGLGVRVAGGWGDFIS
jgi:hypothetical protein